MTNQNKHNNQTVKSPGKANSKSKAAYERDDGYPADELLGAIEKLVSQKDFSGAISLFD